MVNPVTTSMISPPIQSIAPLCLPFPVFCWKCMLLIASLSLTPHSFIFFCCSLLVWHNPSLPHNLHPQCFIREVCCFCVSTCFLCLFLFLQYLISLQILFLFLTIVGTSLFLFSSVVFSLVWYNPSPPHNQHLLFIPILVHSFLFWPDPSQLFFSPFHYVPAF